MGNARQSRLTPTGDLPHSSPETPTMPPRSRRPPQPIITGTAKETKLGYPMATPQPTPFGGRVVGRIWGTVSKPYSGDATFLLPPPNQGVS